ncbi:MAG: glycerol-3-phosphate 1-O-acyltransferase PlsY [Streptococcaceae bacterium]|jgi:glycerol-3-phosphate acyltransferase PlsY|nr:glycerol-3-phosphate 1-O-acyltransferase PlsY [Streptococcaceae bacterium]
MHFAVLLILSYLLGSIPSGYWIGKFFFQKDIRDFGSGNIGTTNTFRVLGKGAGVVVLFADIFKGTLATLLPMLFSSQISPLYCGILAVLGHTFSIFLKFKGGKAVATSGGILLGFAPWFFVYLVVVFVLTLYITSMISFSSITAGIFAFIGVVIFPMFHVMILPERNWLFFFIILALASIIITRHKDNITRIKEKTENTVNFGLNVLNMQTKKAKGN